MTHKFDLRVYYEDTDSGGIVYYANYLKFAERARTEMLRDLGVEHSAVLARDGLAFAVRRCATDYLSPAVLDDALTVLSTVTNMGGASFDMDQVVMRGDHKLAVLDVRMACMQVRGDRTGKPARIPQDLRKVLTADAAA
ncbi:MAG: tol-pal system-associated acyl-CoA thioesterase [Rhodospirillales bacterium]|jgi:acyl-CoA thioester hydrolase|nr:tol-pal system-associated acyl-CoA thioesterase [Rhodospirillales bacterium]MBT4625726.1 tol-pal system-associated acyl-CoA thioesterase [Rhodospirillales bacterium]MBT5521620.1 tol-pal system-associated acyl-CoA thioesterase [Rhodospirillales bacterium]MBT6109875.1 tol-pal system-associated acyl-CoA thioesterase [Rhodospirillales bacterium]MBT6827134.1 tol-pal system-associated acyl-CoA thioesterase [Rhodospirillales bacterium]